MHVLLFDDPVIRPHLLPFTFTRPVAALRCGILTIAEKWQHWLGQTVGYLTEPYLQGKYPAGATQGPALVINGAVCPDDVLVRQVQALQTGEALFCDQTLVAAHLGAGIDMAALAERQWPADDGAFVHL